MLIFRFIIKKLDNYKDDWRDAICSFDANQNKDANESVANKADAKSSVDSKKVKTKVYFHFYVIFVQSNIVILINILNKAMFMQIIYIYLVKIKILVTLMWAFIENLHKQIQ